MSCNSNCDTCCNVNSHNRVVGMVAAGLVLITIIGLVGAAVAEITRGEVIPGTGGARIADARDLLNECQASRRDNERCVIDLAVRVERE